MFQFIVYSMENIYLLALLVILGQAGLRGTTSSFNISLSQPLVISFSEGKDHILIGTRNATNTEAYFYELELVGNTCSVFMSTPNKLPTDLETAQDNILYPSTMLLASNSGRIMRTGPNPFAVTSTYAYEVEFGDNISHFFAVIENTTSGNFNVLCEYIGSSRINTEILSLNYVRGVDMVYLKNTSCLFLLTETAILVRKCEQKSFPISNGNTTTFVVTDDFLAINQNGDQVVLYQTSSFQQIGMVTGPGIGDIVIEGQILYFIKGGQIYQYNIPLADVMSNINFPSGINSQILFFNKSNNMLIYDYSATEFLSVEFDFNFLCSGGCSVCHPGYGLTPELQCSPGFISQNQAEKQSNRNFSIFNSTSNLLSKIILSPVLLSNSKVNFKLFMPLFIFVEDIWPYQFYRETEYFDFMKQCMVEADVLSTFKFVPQVGSIIDFTNKLSGSLEKTDENVRHVVDRPSLEGFGVWWVFASREYFLWGLPISILFCLIIKLAYMLTLKTCLRGFEKGSNSFKVFQALQYRAQNWLMISLFLETGISKTALATFNQLAYPSITSPVQKASLAACLIFLGFLMLYSFFFYIFLNKYYNRSSVIVLVLCRANRRGYFLDSSISVLHKFLRGFIHSGLIDSNTTKIYLIMGLCTIQLLIYIYLRKSFLNKFYFVCLFSYNLVFIVFNCSLLLDYQRRQKLKFLNLISFSESVLERQISIQLILLIILTALLSLTVMIHEIIGFVKQFFCSSNKVIEKLPQLTQINNAKLSQSNNIKLGSQTSQSRKRTLEFCKQHVIWREHQKQSKLRIPIKLKKDLKIKKSFDANKVVVFQNYQSEVSMEKIQQVDFRRKNKDLKHLKNIKFCFNRRRISRNSEAENELSET